MVHVCGLFLVVGSCRETSSSLFLLDEAVFPQKIPCLFPFDAAVVAQRPSSAVRVVVPQLLAQDVHGGAT